MDKKFIPLLLGGLGIGVTEFSMMGITPDLSQHFAISIPQAAYLITAYAIGVVVGAPLLVIISGKYKPKHLLIFLMSLFSLFNFLSALAPNYYILLLFRFLSGLPHGAFFGVGAVVASSMAAAGKQSRAIAVMFSGLTIANLAGVPLATFITQHYSWHLMFIFITAIGIVTIISLVAWLPDVKRSQEHPIGKELFFFKKADAWLIMFLIALGSAGLFSWMSYIAPQLTEMAKFHHSAIPYIMLVAGCGMIAGNLIGARLSDYYSPSRATAMLLCSMVIILVIIHYTSQYKTISIITTFIAGGNGFALGAPMQMLMIQTAKGAEMLASAVAQGCFNISNSLGSFLGGLPIVFGFGYNTPQLVGAAMVTISMLFLYLLIVRSRINKNLASTQ